MACQHGSESTATCKECQRGYGRAYYARHKKIISARNSARARERRRFDPDFRAAEKLSRDKETVKRRERRKSDPDYLSVLRFRANNLNRKLRRAAADRLGGCCEQCGISDERVLQFDHRNPVRRNRKGGTTAVFRSILRMQAPEADFALLCANCHAIKTRTNGEFSREFWNGPFVEAQKPH